MTGTLQQAIAAVDRAAGPFHDWPLDVNSAFFKASWKYKDRFKLGIFFAGDGINPELLWDVARAGGKLRDHAAVVHLESICSLARHSPQFRAKYYTFSLGARWYEHLDGEIVRHLYKGPRCVDCGVMWWPGERAVIVGDRIVCGNCMDAYAATLAND
ncbi:MAG: hypothetical protein EOM68_30425 [Spirochaetia bacterium]|nr:hypothetical protein [Spirochaetia bacterium]